MINLWELILKIQCLTHFWIALRIRSDEIKNFALIWVVIIGFGTFFNQILVELKEKIALLFKQTLTKIFQKVRQFCERLQFLEQKLAHSKLLIPTNLKWSKPKGLSLLLNPEIKSLKNDLCLQQVLNWIRTSSTFINITVLNALQFKVTRIFKTFNFIACY